MVTCEGSTDFSTELSEFTQGRKYGPEALQSQSLAVFQKYHFHKLCHDINIHEQRSACWYLQNEKKKKNPVFGEFVSENVALSFCSGRLLFGESEG